VFGQLNIIHATLGREPNEPSELHATIRFKRICEMIKNSWFLISDFVACSKQKKNVRVYIDGIVEEWR
jgi:hypothetical protein